MITHDLGWWYWFITVGFLATGLLGWAVGLYLAMVLCVMQIGHVIWLTGEVTSFPVQVRVAYLALLFAGLWSPLSWVHWVQLVGTSARVTVGYCFLARVLYLMPWNRREPLSWDLVAHTILSVRAAMPSCGTASQRA